MSNKIHHARCCGCDLPVAMNGQVLRWSGGGDGDFDNMRQVREAAKNHRWFCTNYTGEFCVMVEWYIEVGA